MLLVGLFFMGTVGTAVAYNTPDVNIHRVVVSGVNFAYTPYDLSFFQTSNMFAYLLSSYNYKIVVNAETDMPHACYITLITSNGETSMIGDYFGEFFPSMWFSPPVNGLYSFRCVMAAGYADLIGIAVEVY